MATFLNLFYFKPRKLEVVSVRDGKEQKKRSRQKKLMESDSESTSESESDDPVFDDSSDMEFDEHLGKFLKINYLIILSNFIIRETSKNECYNLIFCFTIKRFCQYFHNSEKATTFDKITLFYN